MTPLENVIIGIIEAEGPLPLDRYMGFCLGHPLYGYYVSRDPFGAAGDFTTAPEISQVFGEMIGVWCITAWQAMGSPDQFALVELGPGRGTLMADILRAAKSAPEFLAAVQVHLVEISPVLRAVQAEKLANTAIWHEDVGGLPEIATIVIANEFFDALPVRQFENLGGQTFERCVGIENGALQLILVPAVQRGGKDGIFETCDMAHNVFNDVMVTIEKHGGLALVIDYGYSTPSSGDSMQAMRKHQYCGILDTPGEADLTAHVDFAKLGEGHAVHLISQREFLMAMGIELRSSQLAAQLDGDAKSDFLAATARLVAANQMGDLFKVMCARQKNTMPIYPFGAS